MSRPPMKFNSRWRSDTVQSPAVHWNAHTGDVTRGWRSEERDDRTDLDGLRNPAERNLGTQSGLDLFAGRVGRGGFSREDLFEACGSRRAGQDVVDRDPMGSDFA